MKKKLTKKEVWKPVVNYEGLYEVSDYGRVRSLDRLVRSKNGSKRLWKGRILSRMPEQDGYHRIQLFKNGKYINKYVHCLVMESFVGPCPEGQQVIHLENVKKNMNNRLSNLRYGSPSCNMAFKYDDGTVLYGERNFWSKLSEDEVKTIKHSYEKLHISGVELAKRFNVCTSTIYAILNGKNWGHLNA